MTPSSDIWLAFARTFSMLLLVLAVAFLAVFLMKKMSTASGTKGGKNLIKVLSVHHLSPKEKLVLLDVLGEPLLIGVTPSHISKIASFDHGIELSEEGAEARFNFSDFLAQKTGTSLKHEKTDVLKKGDKG